MRTALLFAPILFLAPFAASLPLDAPNPVPDVAAGFVVHPVATTADAAVLSALAWGPGDGDGPDLYGTAFVGDKVVRMSMAWTPAGPVFAGASTYAAGFSSPLGLVFDGSTLYVADAHDGDESGRTDGRVWRVETDGTKAPVVDGIPNGRHNTNHLRFGPDGRLYISNGNPNDNGVQGGDADVFPYSGALLSVDAAQVSASPAILHWEDSLGDAIPAAQIAGHARNADFASKVQVLAHGFRNVFGIAFGPNGDAYTAMNGADDVASQDALFRVPAGSQGQDYGFPFCYNVGTPGGVGADVRAEANPAFPGHDCSATPPADALLGWHNCATGIDYPSAGTWGFSGTFANALYVAECGPFFPDPSALDNPVRNTGHKVSRVVLDSAGHATAVEEFLTGLALPTDVLFGPDGAMYVADTVAVYRVAPGVPQIAVAGQAVPVIAVGNLFASPVLVVPAGTAVTWFNAPTSHTVATSDDPVGAVQGVANDPTNTDGDPETFEHDFAGEGLLATYTHTFNAPGTYWYMCERHHMLGMVGLVVVQ